jgi:hypothetical protein
VRKELIVLLFCMLCAVWCGASSAQGLTITASYSEASLRWLFAPQRLESACAADLFAVEDTDGAARRVCLRRNASTGRYEVTAGAKIDDTGWFQVLRGPTATDRGIWLWSPPRIVRYDPVTDARSDVVVFANPEPLTTANPLLFDREGDGQLEAFLIVSGGAEIRSLGTGLPLVTLTAAPWSTSGLKLVIGQFDADPAAELAVFESVGMRLYDAVSLQVQGSTIPTNGAFSPYVLQPLDWDADGRDEFAYAVPFSDTIALMDFNAATVQRFVSGSAGSSIMRVRPVQWVGDAQPELAVFWTDRVVALNPRNEVFEAQGALQISIRPNDLIGFDAQDALGPTLLWNSPNRLVRWSQGIAPAATQEGLRSILAVRGPVGATGSDAEVLTGEMRTHATDGSISTYSRRDATSLVPAQSRVVAAQQSFRMSVGSPHANAGRELLALNDYNLVVSDFSELGLWRIELSAFSSERWGPAAVARACALPACNRVLAAKNAFSSGSAGSFLELYDGNNGVPLWAGPADNCQGCGYHAVALEDTDGDGAPELFSAKLEISPTREALVLRDGVTRNVRWTRDMAFPARVRALDVASDAARAIVALVEDGGSGPVTLQRLNPADGATLRARIVPSTVQRIAYLPYDAARGAWLLLGDPNTVWVIDADLRGGIRALAIDEIEQGGAGELGTAYLASAHTVHRVSVPVDTLFIDEFEDF